MTISSVRVLLPLALAAFVALTPLSALAAAGAIDDASLSTTSTKPSIAGTAEDIKAVRLVVRNDDGKQVFKKDLRVRNEEWKTKVSKKLKDGEYEVSLYEGKTSRASALLDKETLTVGKAGGGTLSASMVPLLTGGTARSFASVPVAYVKVANQGTATSSISGITLVQNGSAPTSVITTFATNDDKGGSRATVPAAFTKQKTVFVPLAATIPPGQMRIFTIKANLGTIANIGSQLKLDVASVAGASRGTFPLRGTTWTLGY